MRWGKGGWDLGSWAGHGFGGSLFPLVPLGGLQARCSGRCAKPWGLFRSPVSWGTQLPSIPLGPARGGGDSGETERGVAGKAIGAAVWRAQRARRTEPQPPAPSGRANDGGGCGVVEGGRAVAGARGMHKFPEGACVRGAGPPTALPARGGAGRRARGREAGRPRATRRRGSGAGAAKST